MGVEEIKTMARYHEVMALDKVAIEFYIPGIMPVKQMAPKWESYGASADYNYLTFFKVECDETLPDAAKEAGVKAYPAFRIYQKGVMEDQVVGTNIDAIIMMLKQAKYMR